MCMYSYNPCTAFHSDFCEADVHVSITVRTCVSGSGQHSVYQSLSTLFIQCQVCPEGNAGPDYDIADGGTEQMWIDTDDTIYLYYTGPDSKSVFGVVMHAYSSASSY